HNFGLDWKSRPRPDSSRHTATESWSAGWREIPAGEAILGKSCDGNFGWDNEYEQVRRKVPAFRIQSHKVTNGEYLRFVEDGAPLPHFWVTRNGAFFYRGMFEEAPLPLDWPVYVTQQEAESYAQWAGKSLMTEEQFDRAAYGAPDNRDRPYPWGMAAPAPQHGNFDFKGWEPEPVYATPAGDSAFGV